MSESDNIKLPEDLFRRVESSSAAKGGIRGNLKKPVGGPDRDYVLGIASARFLAYEGGTLKLKQAVKKGTAIRFHTDAKTSSPSRNAAAAGNYIKALVQSPDVGRWNTAQSIYNQLFSGGGDIKLLVNKLVEEKLSAIVDANAGSVYAEKSGTDEELKSAKQAGKATFESYFPSGGGKLPDGFDKIQKTEVIDFLKDTYRIFNSLKTVWGDMGNALLYGELAIEHTPEPAKVLIEVYGDAAGDGIFGGFANGAKNRTAGTADTSGFGDATLVNKRRDAVLDTKIILIGYLAFAKPSLVTWPSEPLSYAGSGFDSSADTVTDITFGENVGNTLANKAISQIETSQLYQDFVELLKLYTEVIAILSQLSENGEIDPAAAKALGDSIQRGDLESLGDLIEATTEAVGGTTTVSPSAPPKGKKDATAKQQESVANIRTSTRDYLTINTPMLAAVKQRRREVAYEEYQKAENLNQPVEETFQGVYPVEGKPECGVSQLIFNENQQKLLDLTPAEVSSLVPMVRLFKIGPDFEQEIPFESNAINSIENEPSLEVNPNTIIENYNRGNSVGIRSLEWSYQGTNPANDTKDISLTLTLFFQSFSDILRNRHIGIPTTLPSGKTKGGVNTFSYADLITRPRRLNDQKDKFVDESDYDPEYYRIKFLIGYAYSDPINGAGDIIPTDKRLAIDTTVLPIIATLIDHRFDIQEDGSVNLVITYRGYLEAVAHSQGANIFANVDLQRNYEDARNVMMTVLANCESGNKRAAIRANLSSQLDWFGKEIQQLVFSSILTELRAQNKIYTMYPRVEDLISRKIITTDTDIYPPQDPGAFQNISEVIKTARKATGKCTTSDKEKCVEDIFSRNITPTDILADNKRVVPFFYVGDLIKIVKSLVNVSYKLRQVRKKTGTAAENAFQNTRIVLTDIKMTQDPDDPVYEHVINMADIPVSVETFSVWFVKYITKYQGNRQFPEYSFGLFLSDFLSTVLNKFKNFSDESGTSYSLTDAVSIQRAQVYAPVDAIGQCAQKQKTLSYDLFIPGGPCKSITRITQNSKHGPGESEETIQFYSVQAAENWYNYFIFYPRVAGHKSDRNGCYPMPTKDNLDKGFYQFNFGVNSGMVQKVTFEKDDQPYVREARFFAAETNYKRNRILQLREPYKITIETFGLPHIFPGSVCFVDSRTIDLALGAISNPRSLSYMLGFGGYHLITHAKNRIGPGEFNTTLTAKWTSHGSVATLNQALSRKTDAKSENCDLYSSNKKDSIKSIKEAFEKAGGPNPFRGETGYDPNRAKLEDAYPEIAIFEAFANMLHNKAEGMNE
tara:strand:+ start:113 stop:4033 length:3921 start_codon:yes stop_codon:yes gene_type:complete